MFKYQNKTLSEWYEETGVKPGTVRYRLFKGWPIEKALFNPATESNKTNRKHEVVGKLFKDRFGDEYIVEELDHRDKYSCSYYKIRFLKSGYETTACVSQIIGATKSRVFDRLSPSVHNVGILGYAHAKDNQKLYEVWRSMIARCYNPKNPSYKSYGGKGITVCERWKRFDYFLNDAVLLHGFDNDKIQKGELTIDKDIIDRTKLTYSPETCCFVTRTENVKEALKRRYSR